MDPQTQGAQGSSGQWLAGGALAVLAAIVVGATGASFRRHGSLTGFEILILGWATISAFASGTIAWRWTSGARTLLERRIYLALSALGMAFVINAAPYLAFSGVALLFALVVGAAAFGLQAALAAGLWSWVMTTLLRSAASSPVRWSSRPLGLLCWSLVGGAALSAAIAGAVVDVLAKKPPTTPFP